MNRQRRKNLYEHARFYIFFEIHNNFPHVRGFFNTRRLYKDGKNVLNFSVVFRQWSRVGVLWKISLITVNIASFTCARIV